MNSPSGAPEDSRQSFRLSKLKTFRNAEEGTYALVTHNPDLGLISDFWLGSFETQDRFQTVLEFIAAQFETGKYSLWLADLRHMSISFDMSSDWLIADLMPRVFSAGLQREAIVLSEDSSMPEGYDVFGAATHALNRLADGRVRSFTDIDLARNWLLDEKLPS